MVYEVDFLVDRLYAELDKNRESTSKLILVRPDVLSMNRKTFIKNYREICRRLKREELEVQRFFEEELMKKTSIDSKGCLVVCGMFKAKGIQHILTNYIKQYILCKECNGTDTQLSKENRIVYMICKTCLSKKAL